MKPAIDSIGKLRQALQCAIEVELATIPPYLCALYSIPERQNQASAQIIRSVAMEEMLHLVQAANLLNAVGGTPHIRPALTLTRYPGRLPYCKRKFEVRLERFSPEGIGLFIEIELPETSHSDRLPPQAKVEPPVAAMFHALGREYDTIGQFYTEIAEAFSLLAHKRNIFTGDWSLQVGSEHYYSGAGKLYPVYDLVSAEKGIHEIMHQGEGGRDRWSDQQKNPYTGAFIPGHYYRFQEIRDGRTYILGDKPGKPTGPKVAVDWKSVYPMQPNPSTERLRHLPEVWRESAAFDDAYTRLLCLLDHSTKGHAAELTQSVGLMLELKQRAIALMRMPIASDGSTAGPAFEWKGHP
jgi:rubrerythrin